MKNEYIKVVIAALTIIVLPIFLTLFITEIDSFIEYKKIIYILSVIQSICIANLICKEKK